MAAIIKEEIFTTIKKKRFIILTAIMYVIVIAMMIYAKTDYFNDLICLFAMNRCLYDFFNPAAGAVLLFCVYRRRYTNSSITQAEHYGAKRSTAVIARAAAGSIILTACYAIAAVILLLTALIFGANLSAAETGMFLTGLLCDCIAAVTMYVGVLFWLYLFAFPVIPMVLYVILTWVPHVLFVEGDALDNMLFKVISHVLPGSGMNVFAASLIYGNPQWLHLLICIGYIILTLLLTILVFKLKKFKEKKKKGEEVPAAPEAASEVQAAPAASEVPVKEAT